MSVFFIYLKKLKEDKKCVSLISVTLLLFVVVLQNQALLFNPLIIALCNALCLFPLLSACISILLVSIVGFIINVNYGIELVFLFLLCSSFHFLLSKIKGKHKHVFNSFLPSLFLGIVYSFLVKTPTDYINLCISFFLSILMSYCLIVSVEMIVHNREKNPFFIAFLLIFISLSVIKIDSISFLLVMLVYMISLKLMLNNEIILSLFPLIVGMYLFNNIPLGLLFSFFTPIFIAAIIKKEKLNEIIVVLIFTGGLFIYNRKFYLLHEFYEGIGAILISYVFPIKRKAKPLIEKDDRINEITSFCTLLEDKRFAKYNELDQVLINDLKKSVCHQCNYRDKCDLLNKTIISSYIDEGMKKNIIDNCLYSYQVIKKLSLHNHMYFEFSNNQLALTEHSKNLIIPFSLIKKMAEMKKEERQYDLSFDLDIETISTGISEKNGDSYELFRWKNYCYLLLSDGMGHTKESNEVSSYLISLVKSLIPYEESMFSLIKDVNNIMLSKTCEEVYATLDIAQFDLEKGEVRLFKMGSYSSFFIRNKIVKEYPPLLPPLGIVSNVREKEEIINIRKGDIFLFMTDGFGENANEMINSTIQKSSFLSISNYTKFLYNKLKENEVVDDKTIIGLKIR